MAELAEIGHVKEVEAVACAQILCPKKSCGAPMDYRRAGRRGKKKHLDGRSIRKGNGYWRCSRYPSCREERAGKEHGGPWLDESGILQPAAGGTVAPEVVKSAPVVPVFPPAYIEPACARRVMAHIQRGHTVFLSGKPGCGKTHMPKMIGAALQRPVVRVNLKSGITTEMLVGEHKLEGGQVIFSPGVVLKAMTEGTDGHGNVTGPAAILILDELSAALPEELLELQRLLETPDLGQRRRMTVLLDSGNEWIAHPEFAICCTDNTKGMGDGTGLYEGTNQQNVATLDRIGFWFEVSAPAHELILRNAGVVDALLRRKMVRWAEGMEANSVITENYGGVRNLLDWARAIETYQAHLGLDIDEAAKFGFQDACLSRLEEREKAAASEIYQRIFGIVP